MFTEGLDESAINWIKKGSDTEQCPPRSPLSERIETNYHLPRSPLAYNSSSYASSHALPPLKFHSGLVKPLSSAALSVGSDEDESDYYNDEEGESVGSAPHESNSDDDAVDGPVIGGFEEDMFRFGANKRVDDIRYNRSTIRRGPLQEDLRVELPGSVRRFTDGEWGSRGYGAVSGGSCRLNDRKDPSSAYGTPVGNLSENVELGTPSAPPFMDVGNAHDSEAGSEKSIDSQHNELEQGFLGDRGFAEQSNKSVKFEAEAVQRDGEEILGESEHLAPVWQANSVNQIPYYCASIQNAYQALVAYDACVRLCLNSWARGCAEAPEFLRDECLLLRNAFGLHKLLLQPRGVQLADMNNKASEQAMASKVKRTVGKIRVEGLGLYPLLFSNTIIMS